MARSNSKGHARLTDSSREVEPVIPPLDEAEQRAAIDLAISEFERVWEPPAGARFRVLGAELTLQKPAPGEPPRRMIDVLIADYDGRRTVRVLIDANGSVAESRPLEYEPAFHPDEIVEARAIAERDERLARFTRDAYVRAFVPPGSPERRGRIIGLRYIRRATSQRQAAFAVVDLAGCELVSVEIASGSLDMAR
jgi:hypothetical protein